MVFHGKGVYLTPSFRMAASYGFRDWVGEERFSRQGPAGTCFLGVLMCAVPKGKFKVAPGSAFSHSTDGWSTQKIEWVVPDPKNAKPYGVLMCYFKARWALLPFPSICYGSGKGMRLQSQSDLNDAVEYCNVRFNADECFSFDGRT